MPITFSTRDPPDPIDRTLHLAATTKDRFEAATIFVVDHDDAVRDALSLTLRSRGFDVQAYASAKDVLNRFR